MRVSVLVVTVSLIAYVHSNQGYKVNIANINIDEILAKPRVMLAYSRCLLETGPCTPEGREAKKYLPEVLKSNCGKCSEEQKVLTKKVMRVFYKNHKDEWTKIVEKYDPKHEYVESFVKWFSEENKQ